MVNELQRTPTDPGNAEQIASANSKNVALFINCVDGEMYSLIKSLVNPSNVQQKTYTEIKNLLIEHLSPKPTIYSQRFRFYRTMQNSSEPACEFLARLRIIANDCQFENFDSALLDQFLMGISDSKIQSKLLTEKTLTLSTAVEKVLNFEKAHKEAQIMHGEGVLDTNFVRGKNSRKNNQAKNNSSSSSSQKMTKSKENVAKNNAQGSVPKCQKCKFKGHVANKCSTKCFRCGKIGHVANQCHSRRVHKVSTSSGDNEENIPDVEGNLSNLSELHMYYVMEDDQSATHPSSTYMCKSGESAGCTEFNTPRDSIEYCVNYNDNIPYYTPMIENSENLIQIKSEISKNVKINSDSNVEGQISECDSNLNCLEKFGSEFTDHDENFNDSSIKLDLSLHEHDLSLNHIDLTYSKPIVHTLINDKKICMEFDSGSTVSVCSQSTVVSAGLILDLLPSSKTLKVANGEVKAVRGSAMVTVTANGTTVKNLQLYVVDGFFPSLFGHAWIKAFCGSDWLDRVWKSNTEQKRKQATVSAVASVESDCHDLERKSGSSVMLSTECLPRMSMYPCKFCVNCPCICSRDRLSNVCSSSPSPVLNSVKTEPSIQSKDDLEEYKGVEKDGKSNEMEPQNSLKLSEKDSSESLCTSDNSESNETVPQFSLKLVDKKPVRSFEELKNSPIFEPGLGLVKDVEAKLVLKENTKPILLKQRSLPFSLRSKVEEQLNSMIKDKILEKVDDSPWGTPIVPVVQGEKLRICGDYKSTLNKVLETREYPLPTLEDCFSSVSGSTIFTVIDIKQAYNNLMIRESDQILTTLNTHKGLYKWLRLPYGISSSSAIFQGTMDEVLRGIPFCCCRIDDILIGGRTELEHLSIVNEVVRRLEAKGFKCRLDKSQIAQPEVIYLSHRVSKSGIRPMKGKVEDLRNAPRPANVDELISFLSAVNYYRRFLPNLSTIIGPLDDLRKHDVEWKWTDVEDAAFVKLKELLCSERVLTFYDPSLPLKVDSDASSTGIGAVLSHVYPNGDERPIEYISRTLSKAERNYAQIDREALAIVWAIKRFHIYLYMRKFRLVTDHQALVHLFRGNKSISSITTRRIARWALFLSEYDFTIEYRNTKLHGNCDMLSRLPQAVVHSNQKDECEEIFSMSLEESLLDAEIIAQETKKDHILSKVLSYTLNGWPPSLKINGELKAYSNRREEISLELGCLMWGTRVIIPSKLRNHVLNLLHATHIGMVGMKSLARSYVWWSGIDNNIEEAVQRCDTCGKHGRSLPKLQDHPWVKATGPFQRVHIDYAGPFLNNMWLVLQDSYSKWPEVIRMNKNSSAPATVKALRHIFARTGVPMTVVSDNGTQFVADETEDFFRANGVKHVTCPTYSPKSNGLCERFVGTFKCAMKKMYENDKDLDKNLSNFLLTYRNTPHSVSHQPPAVLMYNRTLRFNLQQIKPADKEIAQNLHPQAEQKLIDHPIKQRSFEANQPVYVQLNNDKLWRKATVLNRCGETSNAYEIDYEGRTIKKHADQLKTRHIPPKEPEVRTVSEPPQTMVAAQPNKPAYDRTQSETKTTVPSESKYSSSASLSSVPRVVSPSLVKPGTNSQIIPTVRKSSRLAAKPPINYRE